MSGRITNGLGYHSASPELHARFVRSGRGIRFGRSDPRIDFPHTVQIPAKSERRSKIDQHARESLAAPGQPVSRGRRIRVGHHPLDESLFLQVLQRLNEGSGRRSVQTSMSRVPSYGISGRHSIESGRCAQRGSGLRDILRVMRGGVGTISGVCLLRRLQGGSMR